MSELDICVQQFPPPGFTEWIVDIDATADKVNTDNEEAEWNKPTIYHVTDFVRSQNQKAFTPQVLSFGPFHHGAEHLKGQDVHKRRALAHFLRRSRKQAQHVISNLQGILKELQDSYQGLDVKWKENPYDFLKMMLLDGCFMLEVLRLKKLSTNDYAPNDPVFSLQVFPLRMPYIKRDMLLLENQLPLLVLKALLEVEGNGETSYQDINDMVLKFLNEDFNATLPRLANHPLELYRMSLLQGSKKKTADGKRAKTCGTEEIPNAVEFYEIPNAVQLHESGVHFRTNKSSLTDITFDPKTGHLKLPVIPVHDGTEYLFLNMVAYEQIHVGVGTEITACIVFMDALIDTKEDVMLLQKKGIIRNSLGSNKEVAELFNSLAKEAAHDTKDALNQVRYDLKNYYEKSTNKWLASLRHQYLHNPWRVTSVVAASLVILFTLLQTLYSILAFYLRH